MEDIFPYQPVTDGTMEPLDDLVYNNNKILNRLVATERVFTFLIFSSCGRIAMSNTVQNTNLERYFRYTMKAAFHRKKMVFEKLQWEKVEQRLNGTSGNEKSNTDVRTCYRIDDHKFAVPGRITFGQRTVPPGCVHVLETTVAPMLVFKPSTDAIRFGKIMLKESNFDPREESWYDRFVLQPKTRYQFDVGTTYAFVTTQKTFFSLHVLANPEGLRYGDKPFQHRRLINDSNKIPPPTPKPVLPAGVVPPPKENTFLAPRIPTKRKHREEEEEDVVPKKSSHDDATPPEPRIIKLAKGPYDYPHPDVPNEWYRLEEIIRQMQSTGNDFPMQPVDYRVPVENLEEPVQSEVPVSEDLHDDISEDQSEIFLPDISEDQSEILLPTLSGYVDDFLGEMIQCNEENFMETEQFTTVSQEDIDELFKDL